MCPVKTQLPAPPRACQKTPATYKYAFLSAFVR